MGVLRVFGEEERRGVKRGGEKGGRERGEEEEARAERGPLCAPSRCSVYLLTQ